MTRWLKIARAEFLRDVTTALRYPVELFTGVFILYILFMGLYTGARMLAGRQALQGDMDALIIGYTMWFFAVLAINTMSTDIESEARQGTLEQVCLHAPNYLGLLWVRAFIQLVVGTGMVAFLSVLIQLTTRHFLHITWGVVPAVVVVVALSVIGLCGVGLVLGGLSLLFKRIGQLSSVVQFGLFFLAYTQVSTLPGSWPQLLAHLPLVRGVALLRHLCTPGGSATQAGGELLLLLLDTVVYAAVGSLAFALAERAARRAGTLSHY